MPVHLIPGNHDARDALRAAFADHAYLPTTGFLHYTIEGRPVRLVALDTLVPGKGYGALCAERYDEASFPRVRRPFQPVRDVEQLYEALDDRGDPHGRERRQRDGRHTRALPASARDQPADPPRRVPPLRPRGRVLLRHVIDREGR